ncbi:hypothetical protein F52700_9461 [Fusarium sp. NRRL 52700]|nr:hypothetical protein F52700_9461 [Fusarium sp. NRRL 52700]
MAQVQTSLLARSVEPSKAWITKISTMSAKLPANNPELNYIYICDCLLAPHGIMRRSTLPWEAGTYGVRLLVSSPQSNNDNTSAPQVRKPQTDNERLSLCKDIAERVTATIKDHIDSELTKTVEDIVVRTVADRTDERQSYQRINTAKAANADVQQMKQLLNEISLSNNRQLEALQSEGAVVQQILPALQDHQQGISELRQQAADVEEYLALQAAPRVGGQLMFRKCVYESVVLSW